MTYFYILKAAEEAEPRKLAMFTVNYFPIYAPMFNATYLIYSRDIYVSKQHAKHDGLLQNKIWPGRCFRGRETCSSIGNRERLPPAKLTPWPSMPSLPPFQGRTASTTKIAPKAYMSFTTLKTVVKPSNVFASVVSTDATPP